MSIFNYQEAFDFVPPEHRVTMGEGNTSLIRSHRIGPAAGLQNLWLKLESCNPSGSYKDRFAASAVSHMVAAGQRHCVATSSGNTGSALAAYCAAAGIKCDIAICEAAPTGKLKQMMAYGANIFRVRGFGLDPDVTTGDFEKLNDMAAAPDASLQISAFAFSPLGMGAVRSISYELAEQAETPIDRVFVPAGGGGLTLAVAQGFQQLAAAGKVTRSPRIECVQPTGNNTMAGPLRDGLEIGQQVECTSDISGLQVPTRVDGDRVIEACRTSGGTGHLLEDAEIRNVYHRLLTEEGVYCEPAGAVALAAAVRAAPDIGENENVVCLVTGSGFKDPESIDRILGGEDCPMIDPADIGK